MWGTNGQDSGGEVRELLCRVSEAPTVGAIATKARLPGRKETTGVPTKMALPPPHRQSCGFFPLPISNCLNPAGRCLGTTASRGHCPLVPSGQEGTGGDRWICRVSGTENTAHGYSEACGGSQKEVHAFGQNEVWRLLSRGVFWYRMDGNALRLASDPPRDKCAEGRRFI